MFYAFILDIGTFYSFILDIYTAGKAKKGQKPVLHYAVRMYRT